MNCINLLDIIMKNLISGLLFIGALICSEVHIQAQNMNLAGVYEANTKANGGVRQLYAVLDFNTSQVKDFTQLFTGKTAQFKLLPEDFMNVKKLKKRFAGNTAAGFVRYREKFLLSFTEELKLTNPRLEAGMIVVDWENHSGVKGKCGIIVKEDNSIEFVGLTSLDRTLNPDGLTVTCVEDRCLADVPRAKSTAEGIENYLAEYNKKPEPASQPNANVAQSSAEPAAAPAAGAPAKPHRTANTKLITIDSDSQGAYGTRFCGGLAYVRTNKNGNYYMDKSGNRIFDYYPRQSGHIPSFSDSVAIDCEQFKTAILVNRKGEIIRKVANIRRVTNFVDGIAAVTVIVPGRPLPDYRNMYMNTKGELVFKHLSEPMTMENLKEVRPMCDSLIAYYSYGKSLWGFRDVNGKVIVEPQFIEAHNFSEGMAAVKIKTNGGADKWGYINKAGIFVIQPAYSNEPGDFHNQRAYVQNKEGRYFYIDSTSKILSNPFIRVSDFHNSKAFVQGDGPCMLVDTMFKSVATLRVKMDYLTRVIYVGNDIYLDDCLLSPRGEVLLKGVKEPFYEDLSAGSTTSYNSADEIYHNGYINRKGEYVIEFVESSF